MHEILREMGGFMQDKCNVFQIESVINNKVWPWPLDGLLAPMNNSSRTRGPGRAFRTMLELASYSPATAKRFVRNNLLRSDYRLIGIGAGEVEKVHECTLDLLYKQQNVPVTEQADILVLGVPNMSPYSALSVFNPILLRSLTLGYLMGLFRNRPLVRRGGIIIAYNPGMEKFHPFHHPSYVDFWNRDLAEFYDPQTCWNELAEPYAENPKYLRLYQDGFAYHGTHCLMNWMWSGMCMEHVGSVILAGAKNPAAADKIGFRPARDLPSALSMAKEAAGRHAQVTYQFIPPLFCIDLQ